ncbi:MAG: nitrogenase component 1 [Desulfomonilaceae bacterium]|nr:nitrogenase component 1 [Desulfomonilaceae bacterium]
MGKPAKSYVSTTNACKLCKPLGACLAFKGIEGAVPYLHGSQGCATYMRRYIISHFREPMDIASSSLGEKHAIYGGGPNLKLGLKNVITKYDCRLVGIATTCLTETIGDDTPMYLNEFRREFKDLLDSHDSPELVSVSTPSYSGTHMEGFHEALRAVVDQISRSGPRHSRITIMPGFVSPADTRYLKEIIGDFGMSATIFPDISTSLDGVAAVVYEKLASGGVPLSEIREMGASPASLEFGRTLDKAHTAAGLLENDYHIPCYSLGTPVGLRETDRFFETLSSLSHSPIPEKHEMERGRLIDAYVDAHKYSFGVRAVVYGEEDLVVGLTSFLAEIGVKVVLCASGGESGRLKEAVGSVTTDLLSEPPIVVEGVDFHEIAEIAERLHPDILIGNSKGYHLARRWGVPFVRVGFPIHDRFGGQRILHLGYRGAQSLLDGIVNAVIETRQEASDIGYTYY